MASIINANTDAIKRFSTKLRKVRPEVAKQLKVGVKAGGQIVADQAKENASEFSSTIPPTIKVTASGNTATIKAGNAKVPIAALYERTKPFRHPLFGNRNAWYVQPGSPNRYLHNALAQKQSEAVKVIGAAVTEAIDVVIGGEA